MLVIAKSKKSWYYIFMINSFEAGEVITFTSEAPTVLISAHMPGCGSTSLSNAFKTMFENRFGAVHVTSIGQELRAMLGASNDKELTEKLDQIPDPRTFDPQIYKGLPEDKPVIVDGKLATTVGPQHISPEREVISIDLVGSALTSAVRILRREGTPVYLGDASGALVRQYNDLISRAGHDNSMVMQMAMNRSHIANVRKFIIDSTKWHPNEIFAQIVTGEDFSGFVPEWEIEGLRRTTAQMSYVAGIHKGDTHPNDSSHFNHQYENIQYNIDRLNTTCYPEGIQKLREELKKSLIDCWFGLMLKRVPRFFYMDSPNGGRELVLDKESHAWTPEYYKIAEAWPVLSTILKDKTILDPFAGSGTLVSLLVAREVPSDAFCSDLAYPGGKGINGGNKLYAPNMNVQSASVLFDELPSWYRPDFTRIHGFTTADAKRLPFKDKSVDYVVADPPYGKNTAGGVGLFVGTIEESLRVSREGIIAMVPESWVKDIQQFHSGKVELLTKDVSRGNSKLPVVYIRIQKN